MHSPRAAVPLTRWAALLTATLMIALSCALTLPGRAAAAGPPSQVNNAAIASKALEYVGRYGGSACVDAHFSGYNGISSAPLGAGNNADGECRAFVNCVVHMVTGVNLAWGSSDYEAAFRSAGAQQVSFAAAGAGDVIQWGNGGHTAIVVRNDGANRMLVVDSNYQRDHIVRVHEWAVPSTALIWRLGTVYGVTAAQMSQYAGHMIRNSVGTVDYVAADGQRFWVPTAAVVDCLGGWGQVRQVPDAAFASLPRNVSGDGGGRWADCSTRYVGTMVRNPAGRVDYVAPDGQRFWVPTSAVVDCLGGWGSVHQVSDAVFASLPQNPWGRLASCSTAVVGQMVHDPATGAVDFVAANGTRYHVPTAAVVDCLGGWDSVRWLPSSAQFAAIPANSHGLSATCNTHLIDRPVRRSDGTIDFVASTGVRYWVPNWTVLNCLGQWSSTVWLSDAHFASLPRTGTWASCSTKLG